MPNMLSAAVTGLPIALAVSTLPGPGLGEAPAVTLPLLPPAAVPPRRPWADTDEFLSSLTAKLVGALGQCESALVPLTDLHVASATPAELNAVAIEAETRAPSTNPRAAPGADLGVLTAIASNCPITSASQDAPPRPVATRLSSGTRSPLVSDDDHGDGRTVADCTDSRARAWTEVWVMLLHSASPKPVRSSVVHAHISPTESTD